MTTTTPNHADYRANDYGTGSEPRPSEQVSTLERVPAAEFIRQFSEPSGLFEGKRWNAAIVKTK